MIRRLLLAAGAAALTSAAAATAETAHAEGDPWCDMLEWGEAGGVDCALDAPPIVLFFDYEVDEEGAGIVTLIQSTPEGGERREEDPVTVEWVTASAPGLRDINLDGVPDLFIPISEGMVNVTYFVWQQDADGFYFPSGWISGSGIDGFENRGELIISVERDTAATYIETAQLLDIDGFIHIYDMYIDYAAQSCEIIDPDGILAAGLNEETLVAECEARDWE